MGSLTNPSGQKVGVGSSPTSATLAANGSPDAKLESTKRSLTTGGILSYMFTSMEDFNAFMMNLGKCPGWYGVDISFPWDHLHGTSVAENVSFPSIRNQE